MPSILPGYEYDIFISYRQHDNKRDGWVSNFVQALRDELEATLKNPVSIYFDENLHDGLLETHQVDASLGKKLKCLVFIPIISQTYCDTSSFAWEHEFLAFTKIANEDTLGMNINLSNGNVASRVLAVQIHELDPEDQSTLEKELGGPLRSIKFIHQASGVNRPLTRKDDQVRESGKVLYTDQINKVANALKEIGTSILGKSNSEGHSPIASATKPESAYKQKKKRSRIVKIIGIILIPILFTLAYYINSVFFDKDSLPELTEKTIAVLPFIDMSPAKDQEWFSAGLTEELLNTLSHVPDLVLKARTSSSYFQGKNLSIEQIADSINVEYILQGSVRKMREQLRISTQLIKVSTGANIWSNTYDRTINDIFIIQEDIAENIAQALDILLDDEKRSRMYSVGTKNIEAYEEYLKGDILYNKAHNFSTLDSSLLLANYHFEKAIELDPTFSQPYAKHQDFYSHYFFEEKRGVYKYVLDGYTDNEINNIIHSDLDAAIQNSAVQVFKIGYKLDKIFLSDNWEEAPALISSFKNLSEEDRLLLMHEFSWFTHLFNYADPEIINSLYLKRIENDSYDYSAHNLFLSSLIRMNLFDSATSYFDTNNIYVQGVPMVAKKRAVIAIMKGDFEKAHIILKKAFLMQNTGLEYFNEFYVLSKLLVGDNEGLSDVSDYFSQQGLRSLPFYNITGQYEKADSIAHAFDAEFLGPCIISRSFFGQPLLFHLSATPNFAARLSELGIDLVQFEKENYVELPVIEIPEF